MDILSHALWGWVFLNGETWYLVFLFGILPDIISFGPSVVHMFFSGNLKPGKPDIATIPNYVFVIYNIIHSFAFVALVFLVIFLITKKVYLFMLAWPIHILMDIPTHSKDFFPTKFLYPFSHYSFNGINWGQLWFMTLNYTLLFLAYGYLLLKKSTIL
ncbi:MAG: hypothetical protein ABIB79_04010 [archaeon]